MSPAGDPYVEAAATPGTAAPRPSLARNLGAVLGAQVATKALSVVVSIVMVRWLGADALGRYSLVVAFCFPFGALADFGLATLATREISRAPQRAGGLLASVRRLAFVLAGVSVVAMLAVASLVGRDVEMIVGVAIVGLGTLVSARTTPLLVLLAAREELHLVSLHRTVGALVAAAVTLTVLSAGGGVLALLTSATVTGVLMFVLARRLAGAPASAGRIPVASMAAMLRQTLPFGLLMLVFALHYRIDVVLLDWFRGARDVGLYAAAYRFLDAVVMLAAALGSPLFPRLSALVAHAPDRARTLLEDVWRPLLGIGLPLTLATMVLADDLVLALFGAEFAEAGALVRVLIAAALPLLWVTVANHAVIASDRTWALTGVYAASAVVDVVGMTLLAPTLGARGACLVTLVSEWLTLVAVVVLVRRTLGVSFDLAGVWRYGVASALMLGVLVAVRPAGLAVAVAAGVATYGAALLAVGYRRSRDMIAVRRLLAQ